MTLYTSINGVVKELTGLRSGVGGAVKTNSQMYGGVAGSTRRIFPKYTDSDMSHILIEAQNCYIYDHNGNRVNGSSSVYSPIEQWYDENAKSYHSASLGPGYETSSLNPRDYYWNAYSFGECIAQLNGYVYMVFKDGTRIDLASFLKNTYSYKYGTVNTYDLKFQVKHFGNGTWNYNYTVFNRTWSQIASGTFYIKNTVSATTTQDNWDKGYSNYQMNAANLSTGYWMIYMKNHATSWSGSATGFGCSPGSNSGIINGITVPIRLGSVIQNLAAPTY